MSREKDLVNVVEVVWLVVDHRGLAGEAKSALPDEFQCQSRCPPGFGAAARRTDPGSLDLVLVWVPLYP